MAAQKGRQGKESRWGERERERERERGERDERKMLRTNDGKIDTRAGVSGRARGEWWTGDDTSTV